MLLQQLKKYWGYSGFRPLQEEIIQSVLSNNDTLALMPTGGGKSVCYQLPAISEKGKCLVISPLIALMKDQVDNLKSKGILAAAIYSGMSQRMIVQILKNVADGPYRILYVSPERLNTNLFREFLPALDIRLIAVDEAHCISQWGYDFRPSYMKIVELRNDLPDATILALTASATPEVQQDICEKLGFGESRIFKSSFVRENLCYAAIKSESKYAKLIQIVRKYVGSTIIYCRNRRKCQEIAKLLQLQGFSADYYHAGLSAEERNSKQNDWIHNKTTIIVCTNAFGMGIDKKDVRLVLHVDIPDSLEGYYQEAGRAGRDGLRSYAMLLYNESDFNEVNALKEIRYPGYEEIKTVYKSLVNYLQIPSNFGENESYSFKLETFINNFKLNPQSALYALKALEQDGWIYLQEKSYKLSSVVFRASRKELEDYLINHPKHEPLLTGLLRTYAGIFDYPTQISERKIASILQTNITEVEKSLHEIAAYNIIEYIPFTDDPQITFLKNRVAIDDFHFDYATYDKRKKAFANRVNTFVDYINNASCRNGFINKYFGGNEVSCGTCDNCINNSQPMQDDTDFHYLLTAVISNLSSGASNINRLSENLSINKDKLWPVLNYLQSEQKIRITDNGDLIYQ